MLTQSVMEEFSFLQSVLNRDVEPASFAYSIQSDIQSEIDKYKKKLLSEKVAELRARKVLRENYLAGCFKYLDCLDCGDPKQMSPVDLCHLAVVFNLSWGYLAVCIIAYGSKGQGLFMRDYIRSLQGSCKFDRLFDVSKSRNIIDKKTLVEYINNASKSESSDDAIEDALQSFRDAGFIDDSNNRINGTTVQDLAGFCKLAADKKGINNWTNRFAKKLGTTSNSLKSSFFRLAGATAEIQKQYQEKASKIKFD